jgi:hypothetical protein
MCIEHVNLLAIISDNVQNTPNASRKTSTTYIDKILHRTTRRPATFNPPSNFSKTDIWGPKFKQKKTLIHAKKRRISIFQIALHLTFR